MAAATEEIRIPMSGLGRTLSRFGVLRVGLALFLIIVAALKFHGLAVEASSQDSVLASASVQFAVAEIEILLALWLLWGRHARLLWLTTILFFSILAAISASSALGGGKSCHCFGALLHVSPWIAMGIDLLVVALLSACRPSIHATTSLLPRASGIFKTALGAVVIFGLVAGVWVALHPNDPMAAISRLRGELLQLSPIETVLGDVAPNSQHSFSITLNNNTDAPLRITGVRSCPCSVLDELPALVPPRTKRTLTLQARIGDGPGNFVQRFLLYTDAPTQPYLLGQFSGHVVNAGKSKS